ncbi:hypothetical protein DEI89_11340 [Curtobacterium sp. MCBD17_030]|nr:hypothetical protein DEI89_11340 [Curtobacterium sp. MCBD17_030]
MFFIAGVVRGFQIPLLLVVEGVFPPDARFGDCGYIYSSPIGLQEHVEAWLEDLPTAPGTNRRLGRLNLRVELPIQSFGQYVAEYEKDELSDYFVQTSQFRAVIDGTATVFVGRKGTGKTATMSQAVEELRKDRRNLVVAVKPTSYEFGAMTELLAAMPGDLAGEYLMLSVWTYLLYTEIGLRALSFASEQPARGGANLELQALESELGELGAWPDEDISVRLERLLDQLRRDEKRDGESSQQFVSRALKLQRLGALRSHITSTLRTFDRVAVLLDNLDKTWERGADYRTLSRFILALLTTIGRVQKEFAREEAKGSAFRVSLAVFLRTDIHDALAVHAREPDKIDVRVVQWHDEELLSRVLEERFAAKRTTKRTDLNLWADLFDTEVRGLETRDYLMWRILPRPRDFVFLANAALTTALDRQHAIIKSSDILFAEKIYSRFAVDALMVEGDAESFDLEDVLYGFTGLDSTLSETELRSAIGDRSEWEIVRDWLIQTSFLGVEVQPGEFRHVEGRREARKVSKLGERYARRVGGDVMFRIHPAFRADLDVRDDDLHDADIKDVTLDIPGAD